MKNLLSLSLRYLKTQKRRTIATALGIIMSVALVTGTALLVNSYQDASLRSEIIRTGSWHFKLNGEMTPESIKQLGGNYLIDTAGIASFDTALDMGEKKGAYSSHKAIKNHEVLYLRELSPDCLPMMPYVIIEGRMPENANEIALHRTGTNWDGYELKVGDKLSKPYCGFEQVNEASGEYEAQLVKKGEREFTVVGIYESPVFYQGPEGEGLTVDPSGEHNYFAYVKVKSGIDYWKALDSALNDCGLEELNVTGSGILSYLGQGRSEANNSLRTTLFIVAVIIMSVMVIVISNAFSMSMSEKISQIGMLRCIGTAPAQIRSIIMGEAMIIWAVALPIGLLAGVGAMAVVFSIVNNIESGTFVMKLIPSAIPFVLPAVLSLLAVLVSAYLPARRANRMSMVEAVKGTPGGRIDKIKKNRKGKFWRMMFGFPGFLAAKNIRRNPRRFRVTVLSVIVAVAMFVSLGGFSSGLFSAVRAENNMLEKDFVYSYYDPNAYGPEGADKEAEEIIEDFKAIKSEVDRTDGVENSQLYVDEIVHLKVPGDRMSAKYIERTEKDNDYFFSHYYDDGMWGIYVLPIDRENYKTLKFASAAPSYDELVASGEVLLMQKVSVVTGGGRIITDAFANYRNGDEAKIGFFRDTGNEKIVTLRIGGILKEYPWYAGSVRDGCIVIPEENFYNITGEYKYFADSTALAVKMQDGKEAQAEKAFSSLADSYQNVIFSNEYRSNLENKNLFTIMSIFIYGFMAVVILICCVSVFNTINASLLMRQRETAMIRAVGMSRGQLVKMLLLECSLYGVIGTFWGSIIGVPLLLFLSAAFNNIITASLLSPFKYVAMALVASVLISIIAGSGPIRKIIKTPVIDQIRSQD